MIGLPYGGKNYDDMLSRFHTIQACYGRTDGQTDRITMSISRVSSSMLTRDKNEINYCKVKIHTQTLLDTGTRKVIIKVVKWFPLCILENMEKMMSVLLMLVILDLFIPSSQAVTCFNCETVWSTGCDDPFTSSSTCTGDMCVKSKYTVNGR